MAEKRGIMPPNEEGKVDVIMTNPDGQSVIIPDAFNYVAPPTEPTPFPPPVVDSFLPSDGPTEGGTIVTIIGSFHPDATMAVVGGLPILPFDPPVEPPIIPPISGAWFTETWEGGLAANGWSKNVSSYVSTRPNADPPSSGPDGEVDIVSAIGTPWGGDRVLQVTQYDLSATPCGRSGPTVGVQTTFPRAAVDQPTEIWLDTWGRWEPGWTSNFCPTGGGEGSPEQKYIQIFDNRSHSGDSRWNLRVASQGSDRIRTFIREWDGTGAVDIDCAIPPGDKGAGRLTSTEALFDGLWHRLRVHYLMGGGGNQGQGAIQAWIDDDEVFDNEGLTSFEGVGDYFKDIDLGFFSNHRPDRQLRSWFGPLYMYVTDPGW